MGIQGLLPMFRGSTKDVHVSAYAHKTLAVDGYAWLHRGVHACATELGRGLPCTQHIEFCLSRVQMLLHYRVRPLLVFDGGALPAKKATEVQRRAKRNAARRKAHQLLREDSHEAARQAFCAAVDVTPAMAAQLCDAAKARWGDRVDFLVAPYEADAQLAQLARSSQCDGVISEDSDNLPYGVPRTLFKLDATGQAKEIALQDLYDAPEGVNAISIRGWTHDMFVLMCCMSGCDYAESVDGVGVKKAHALVGRYRDFDRVLRALRFEHTVPRDYAQKLERAVLTFGHQTVFDRSLNAACYLTPLARGGRQDRVAGLPGGAAAPARRGGRRRGAPRPGDASDIGAARRRGPRARPAHVDGRAAPDDDPGRLRALAAARAAAAAAAAAGRRRRQNRRRRRRSGRARGRRTSRRVRRRARASSGPSCRRRASTARRRRRAGRRRPRAPKPVAAAAHAPVDQAPPRRAVAAPRAAALAGQGEPAAAEAPGARGPVRLRVRPHAAAARRGGEPAAAAALPAVRARDAARESRRAAAAAAPFAQFRSRPHAGEEDRSRRREPPPITKRCDCPGESPRCPRDRSGAARVREQPPGPAACPFVDRTAVAAALLAVVTEVNAARAPFLAVDRVRAKRPLIIAMAQDPLAADAVPVWRSS